MASGLPDYYRGVDVAYQALDEMIVRPKYGGAILSSGLKLVGEGIPSVLVTIEGKGMTYGGVVWLDFTSTQANAQVIMGIDDEVITDLSFLRLLTYGINKPQTWPVSLLLYDATNYVYSVGISYGITFEENLSLYFDRQVGTYPTVHWRLVYTLI